MLITHKLPTIHTVFRTLFFPADSIFRIGIRFISKDYIPRLPSSILLVFNKFNPTAKGAEWSRIVKQKRQAMPVLNYSHKPNIYKTSPPSFKYLI